MAEFDGRRVGLLDLAVRWLLRAGELVARYRDLPLGLVDATVIAATEMLGEPKVVTLDRGHFSVVRPAHVEALAFDATRAIASTASPGHAAVRSGHDRRP